MPDSKLKKAIRSLQGFERIHLEAGETRTVKFELKPNQFAARNNENVAVVESGTVQLSIGGKQPDAKSIESKQVVQQTVTVTGSAFYVNE